MGLVDEDRWRFFNEKREKIERELARLRKRWVQPGTTEAVKVDLLLEKPMAREYSLADLLARPHVDYVALCQAVDDEDAPLSGLDGIDQQVAQQVEIQLKYQGYINRQEDEIDHLKRQENTVLPGDFDYQHMQGLSNELKQKLILAKPENIGRASRIPGMTPAAISLLLVYLKKFKMPERKAS